MSIFDKFIRWCDKTPTVSGPTKEEIRKATKRLEREQTITKHVYGGSHVERPKRTDAPQLPKIPSDWNKEIKKEKPMKKDIIKEIEWEYSEEGAKELRHLFAMYHLNDKVWQKKRREAINLAVYGDENTFDERPYYHLYTFHDEFGFKKQTYPKYKKDVALEMYKHCKKAVAKGIIGYTILLKGYKIEED